MSENWRQSEICIVINDKSQEEPSIKVVMGYFITNLSLNLLVKAIFNSVNICGSYRQNG